MKRYTKANGNDIPLEEAHGGSGLRQVLVKPEQLATPYFEAMTKGYLKPGLSYDWHTHEDVDEIFIVLKGRGMFYWENEETGYVEGDIFTIPANSRHKISAGTGINIINEFYFVRVKCK